jgi:hypothetical protein
LVREIDVEPLAAAERVGVTPPEDFRERLPFAELRDSEPASDLQDRDGYESVFGWGGYGNKTKLSFASYRIE